MLVKPPPNINIVGSQIILHYKLDKDGKIGSHKSQLIAQGFTQQEGIKFTDTFSPTAKLIAVRIIAAIAVRNDWELEQTDINAAYLNASLKEDIYAPAERFPRTRSRGQGYSPEAGNLWPQAIRT